MFKIEQASRSQLKLKILVAGPSGSGKTMSTLKLAHGMVGAWEKIVVIDTENRSSALYSHLGPFLQIPFEPPYTYERYLEALKYAESQPNIEAIIIDGISQMWEMEGGALERHAKLGGRFQDWSKIKPIENKWNEAIKKCSKHLFITGRTKTDYSIDKDDRGKAKIEKMGTKLVQREGFEYEMTIAFRLDVQHFAYIDKDRTDLFNEGIPFIITEKVGLKIKEWNESGKPMIPQETNDTGMTLEQAKLTAQNVFETGNDEKVISEVAQKSERFQRMVEFLGKAKAHLPKEWTNDQIKAHLKDKVRFDSKMKYSVKEIELFEKKFMDSLVDNSKQDEIPF